MFVSDKFSHSAQNPRMGDRIDMSLEEIIKGNKKPTRGGARGRGGATRGRGGRGG